MSFRLSLILDDTNTVADDSASDTTTMLILTTGTESPRLAVAIEVSTERNVTQVNIICPSGPRLFPGIPGSQGHVTTPDANDADAYATTTLVTPAVSGRGVEVDLSQLECGGGNQLVVDVEGCGHVGVGGGVPEWAEGLTLAIKGSLVLKPGWWGETLTLREMWMRVASGVDGEEEGGLCETLPPSLEMLDISHTPMETLTLKASCAPPALQRLEASHAALLRLALCAPSLVTLHVSGNEVGGGMQWAACDGGVASVEYLQANGNQLTAASTCGWGSLRNLDLRHNLLAGLDLASCPPANLTHLTAAHNYLATPPTLPPALLQLDLSHNLLTTFPILTHALMEVDLSHNKVVEVGKSTFKRARKLLHLNLAFNRLTQLHERDFVGLRTLRTLDVSHNRLLHIAPATFNHLHNLRRLHLHKNRLVDLDARDLATLKVHTHVTVHDNPWACSCQLLADLSNLQACPTCQQESVALECRERGTWTPAKTLLHSCLQAVQEVTQWHGDDKSDEDLSEEEPETLAGGGKGNPKVVMVVPGLVVLLLVAITALLSYRLYHRHRHAITSRLAPFCGFCGHCAPNSINNNHHNHQRDQLSQIGNDSDTETEL
nr:leucine-rich repeats and immunoglobulin-like domains protein 1 [Cherax quadricarinatus]